MNTASVRVYTAFLAFAGISTAALSQSTTPPKSSVSKPSSADAAISPKDLEVPTNVAFDQQVRLHGIVFGKLADVSQKLDNEFAAADTAKSYELRVSADEDKENLRKALVPYAVGEAKANALIAQGYKLNDLSGQVCKGTACIPIDPIAAMFFLTNKAALGPKLANPSHGNASQTGNSGGSDTQACPEGDGCSLCINGLNICTAYKLLAKLVTSVRDTIIPKDNNGEIAKFIRDPGKTTLKAVQDLRDRVVSKNDHGEGAKILRDPIKCTVGKLFHKC